MPSLHHHPGHDRARARPEADPELQTLLRRLYEAISFEEGGAPDWPALASICSPQARFTRLSPEGTDHVDLAGFRELVDELIELGTYTSFHEREIARQVAGFGALAHVLSAYETCQGAQAVEPFARGVNSIQLLREADGWRLLSLLWDEERDDNPIDVEALFGPGAGHV